MKTYDRYKPSGIDWIGDIPEHWNIKKLKFSAWLNKLTLSEKTNEDFVIRYIDIGSVDDRGNILSYSEMLFSEAPSRARRIVNDGDTIVSTVRTYLRAIAFVPLASKNVICSTGFAVIAPNRELFCPKFLFYFCRSEKFIDAICASSKGVSYPAIDSSDLKNFFVWIPKLEEQTAIAKYLDEKTAQIDKLIANKERLIELLKEERLGVINQAVTRGINPHAKLKPSGIDWLGDIPEHWTLTKIAYISKVVRGASPRPAGDTRFFNGEHTPWITVAEVTKDNNKFLTSVSEFLTEEGAKLSRFVEVGILLLSNSGATLGVPKILKIGGCINDGSVAFLNLHEKILIDFLYYFFKMLTGVYREQMKGSGQPNLNTDIIKATFIGLPLIEEQKQIVQFIETATDKIDSTIAKIENEIELLKEYRTALISEVVTGKIKVVQSYA